MNRDNVEEIEYKDYTIEIMYDDNSDSPRDWDNLGTMVCSHSRYNLGDKQVDKYGQYEGEDIQDFLNRKDILWLPLYLYDHSGLSMSTGHFQDPWDSGQVGFIYVTKEQILKEYGGKIVTKKNKEIALRCLKGEVETYDQYLRNDVYGYNIVNPKGEDVDSCWGFYGMDYCIEEAKSMVDWNVQHELEVATELPAFMI